MAIVRSDPHQVLVATDTDVLTHLVALKVVATTDSRSLPGHLVDNIQTALLDERWGDAVTEWVRATGESLDAYPDEEVWSDESLENAMASFEVRMAPIFNENQP